jgi:hypothetical protein
VGTRTLGSSKKEPSFVKNASGSEILLVGERRCKRLVELPTQRLVELPSCVDKWLSSIKNQIQSNLR